MMRLVDETDLVAADSGPFVVRKYRGRAAIDIDIAVIGVLKQPGDM